jgi:DNA (cytosine-5)-methyltransferase 1
MFIRWWSGSAKSIQHERYMDSTPSVTHIGLCAGYGGIELGLKRAIPNLRTIALCEVEAFAIANLVAKMESGQLEPAPIWPNLKTFPWESFRDRVDILTGGYPCQPFSAAGKRQGADDPRHLWPYIARGIRILQPRICFFENVEGHISLGLSDVIEDLAGMGYRTTWGIFSASECGAPHQRKRVFIMAVASGFGGAAGISGSFPRHEGQSGESDDSGGEAAWPSRPNERQHRWEPPRVVENTGHKRQAKQQIDPDRTEQSDIWQTQPPMGGNPDGSSGRMDYAQLCVSCDNRTDELRLLGNGVVPATAELAYRTLARELLQIPS